METKIRCKHCKATNYKRKGFRQTENRGRIQKYYCFKCKHYFTNDDGFYRMRNHEGKITEAIDLYFSNLSSRKVRNHFRRHRIENSSHVTILDWCRKYVLKVHKFTDTLQPQLSGQIYADETMIDRRGAMAKAREKLNNKGELVRQGQDVFWCSVDWGTRYINATLYSPLAQNLEDATLMMMKIKRYGKPKYIQTDALPFYKTAISKTFYNRYEKEDERVKHFENNVSKTGKHNVRIETVFSKIKDRVDDFRGLKALWSAPILMQGIILQHNFIEQHTTTGKIPSELARLNLSVWQNRWLGMIRLSVTNQCAP